MSPYVKGVSETQRGFWRPNPADVASNVLAPMASDPVEISKSRSMVSVPGSVRDEHRTHALHLAFVG